MPEPFSYDSCRAKSEIQNLKTWQESQNGQLRSMNGKLDDLCAAESKRQGAEGMLKWVIGIVGFTGIIALVNLFSNVLGLG